MKDKNMYNKVLKMAKAAKAASFKLALIPTAEKNNALKKMAAALISGSSYLITENKKDLAVAKNGNYSKALIDRLTLNEKRINDMAKCLIDTSRLKDPIGEIIKGFKRPNGLLIKKVRVPFGVIGIIFESRPNVTSDCIGLCLKSGNSAILKGGKEAFYSNKAIFFVLKSVLKNTKIPQEAVQLIDSTDRKSLSVILGLDNLVDLIVPRGGEGLIRFVAENSKIPIVKHYKGVCHVYVSEKADLKMAEKVCFNAKVQRPGVCNAMETMLVNKKIAKKFLPVIIGDLKEAGVEIRGCPVTRKIISNGIKKATVKDWYEEYLDLVLSVRVVDSVGEAIEHINTFGSKHSDAIVTNNREEAKRFLTSVDSSCVYVNASTRFTDGYEFGFGAEVGISTDKLHARGPMALEELTTYKYLIYGKGQIRT